ncbi:MAG: hypothetical protein GQ523_00805 [Methanophagales archaeon]|nr:hypothetical protein [Methanophagales archaeon]
MDEDLELHEITRNYTKDINAGGTMRVMMHQMKDVVKRGSEKANMDFTVKKYKDLCLAVLDSGYTPLTVYSYLVLEGKRKRIISWLF